MILTDTRSAAFRSPSLWKRGVLAAACVLGAAAVQGQSLEQSSQQWLNDALAHTESAAQEMPLRLEVELGRLDPRLKLAPCARMEHYLPSGSKLWGRTRIGIRCLEGTRLWNVFLPVTVKAWGPAWVLTNNVSMGEPLGAQDAMQSEVDWAAERAAVIALPDDWVGQSAARALMSGQALRQGMVRAPQLFKTGSVVKVISGGTGFRVTSSGQALSAGGQGQTVRVRMDNGRMVSGTVNAQGDVVVNQ